MNKDQVKIILASILIAVGLFAVYYNSNKVTEDSKRFKEEYEKLNNTTNDNGKKIRNVSIPKSNPMKYITANSLVEKMEKKETFIVYFGFNECPWCRSVIETFIETAKENNIKKVYYVDIKNIRDTYELDENNELIKTKKGSNGYNKLLEKLDNVLSEYTLTDESGNKIDTKEKRIYAPNMVAVVKGKAKYLTTGISSKQTDAYMKLTTSMKNETKKEYKKLIEYIK